jgi:hypothetical protein
MVASGTLIMEEMASEPNMTMFDTVKVPPVISSIAMAFIRFFSQSP